VQYTAYGNSEEVPLAYLKPVVAANKTTVPGTERVGKNNLKPGPDGLIPIPESLTILPTDTEKVLMFPRLLMRFFCFYTAVCTLCP